MATTAMLKAGADHAATGENAVIVGCSMYTQKVYGFSGGELYTFLFFRCCIVFYWNVKHALCSFTFFLYVLLILGFSL